MKALNFAIVVLAFASSIVNAYPNAPDINLRKVAKDVASLKQLLPSGVELAGAYSSDYDTQTQKMMIKLKSGDDYLYAVSSSYIFTDLNNDGVEDLVVAVENAPATDASGWMSFGQRSLQIYRAQGAAGSLTLLSEGSHVILNGDEGGVFGDPFDGLQLKKNGAFKIFHYGGSADRWELNETFQYRNGEVYLIGTTTTNYNTGNLNGTTVDTNLITGDQIVTKFVGDKSSEIHRKIKVKPLVELSQATVEP